MIGNDTRKKMFNKVVSGAAEINKEGKPYRSIFKIINYSTL